MSERLKPLLADDWAAVDPTLPPILEALLARSAGEDWHKAGTFKDHLLGTYRTLALWDQPREVRLLGLFHSVYSNEYVDLKLFDAERGRDGLRALLGEETERLVHLFCTMPRSLFTRRLAEAGELPEEGMALERPGKPDVLLSTRDVAVFAIATIADIAEQWHSWQDEIFSEFPASTTPRRVSEHWSAALWPGPLKPTAKALSLLSRLARPLAEMPEEWGLPVPPVFARCNAVLSPEQEMAASSLYWQAVTRALPQSSPGPTRLALETAAQLNPFVGEPRLLLAQLALAAGEWDRAAADARAGLDLLSEWGTAWDKRVAWSGWVAWARILLRSAERRRWPDHLAGLNGLGLVS
ncbi:DUF6817 domain-containing protein [Siccirubricoccus phaeus]|uniref:DUF6817 domain-containing protein n=1 Tax=Siccirubricoccus phaeus TaxID=2595053 RepID=UPI0011F3773B|nr:tetratricopeptide repeat protein [Siccirubricoccus phaeus]